MTNFDDTGMSYEDFMGERINKLYSRKINGRVDVTVCQTLDGGRSQFLALVIHDSETGRWIVLKLSTFRKVWAFLVGKRFDEARHMKFSEVKKLVRQDEQRKASGKQE